MESQDHDQPLTTPEDQLQFDGILDLDGYAEVKTMATTWFEQGIEKGKIIGQRKLVLKVLANRFGTISKAAEQKVADWAPDQIDELMERAFQINSLEEL